jgi:uncharacterized damage-inducible protein DinB
MTKLSTLITLAAIFAAPILAEDNVQATILKHLKTSRDFTLKVAEQMPEATYDFKLTPPQMSFADQMIHLSQGFEYFLAPIYGEKPNPAKPASLKKPDVIAYVKKAFDHTIERVSKLTPAQLSKTYKSDEGSLTGLEMLLGMLDHTTHHRASAEMYLRAKGITPAEYQF